MSTLAQFLIMVYIMGKWCELIEISSFGFLGPPTNPTNSPLGPQKAKNDPKIKSKSNVRFEGNIGNESCLTT